ncbi:hypothetical protein E4631_22195 [Hymenobacter sp. UV11]|uniref:hypothetical protein n=1 Tax=Hymenobacter sp. UV11 TaxID=1849735 RepID=UPI00105CA9A9|nr:hypothetical protein [Hymenobacter sp. UV11]TDN38633.1 hypothetical protein A8B98_22625 [Hymenobacter sp. UV11]TFZ63547.1 hypothetical protein E4631_22195 [Hymenobacter sp. UV11]
MTTAFFLSVRRVSALTLLALGLTASHPGDARPLTRPATPPTVGLRVIITPLPGSAVLRVRYESDDCAAVRLRVRDAQGQVLYSELKQQARFAGDYILTAFPAGTYTLELQTPGACYSQTVRLYQRNSLVATLTNRPRMSAPVL